MPAAIRLVQPERKESRFRAFPLGAVVATAVLDWFGQVQGAPGNGWVEMDGKAIPTDPYGDFSPGRWLWFLEDIEPLKPPIPAKGRQGFWDWHDPR